MIAKSRVLIDSNILAYAFDSADEKKHKAAVTLLTRCWEGQMRPVVSLQNLAEFFHIATKKFKKPIPIDEVEEIIEGIIAAPQWEKVAYDSHILQHAMIVARINNDFWDALLISTMIANDIDTIYTENTKDFEIKGIRAVNPFG